MEDLFPLLTKYGYTLLAAIVFAEAIGLPVPAAPALLAAGAAAAKGILLAPLVVAAGMGSMLAGDTLLFFLGRWTGWWLLGLLCRFSPNPEACIYSSAAYFYKRGRTTLVFAKFLPGVNTMAPPIAGSMNMAPATFFLFDFAGTTLYIMTYLTLGFLFSEAIGMIGMWISNLGRIVGGLFIAAIAGYLFWRWWRLRKLPRHEIPRVSPLELASALSEDVIVADVRSHGYYDENSQRIQGSIRLEPNRLPEAIMELPPGKTVYLYCSCLQEATSDRVAQVLKEAGFEAKVLHGGLNAWRKAGLPTEAVPAADIVHLPSFR
jgi:membrane protein DedA with SNARE-associated domain/rhodanese-related sulfurtransferase